MTTPNTYASPKYDLPGSLFFVFTAQNNNGKTFQISSIITAKAPDGRPAVMPCLFLVAESSSEGTAGHVLADPGVITWGVRDFDEALHVLKVVFPEGRPPLTLAETRKAYLASEAAVRAKHTGASISDARSPMDHWPIRSVAVDSASTLLAGQKTKIREASRDERGDKARKVGGEAAAAAARFTHKRDAAALDLDEKRIAGIAYGPAIDMADALSGIATRHRGTLVVVACHAAPAKQAVVVGEGAKQEVKEIVVGEVPDFGSAGTLRPGVQVAAYSRIWNNLHAKANIVWHLYSTAPDLTTIDPAHINAKGPGLGVQFGAVTERGIYPRIGAIGWAKRQGGEGWLGWFDDAAPRLWHPDVPWTSTDPQTGEVTDLQAAFTAQAHGLPSCRMHKDGPEVRYRGGPDAGLLLELCLADHAARKAGA